MMRQDACKRPLRAQGGRGRPQTHRGRKSSGSPVGDRLRRAAEGVGRLKTVSAADRKYLARQQSPGNGRRTLKITEDSGNRWNALPPHRRTSGIIGRYSLCSIAIEALGRSRAIKQTCLRPIKKFYSLRRKDLRNAFPAPTFLRTVGFSRPFSTAKEPVERSKAQHRCCKAPRWREADDA